MVSRLAAILAPLWVALYLVVLRWLSGVIFVPLVLQLGFFQAALIAVLAYGTWGTILYIFLAQSKSLDRVNEGISYLAEKKKWRVLLWLRSKFSDHSLKISPFWICMVFIFESPLTGVPLVRLAYPPERWWIGIMWVWIGAILEVTTWFVPIYGGGLSVVRAVIELIW